MSLQTKVHRNLEPLATSAPQGKSVKTSAADSPRLEEIRIRAYEIYVERGGQPGHDLDDWLQAERELEPKEQSAQAGK
jgi:Protein of unknown function (DUF2934)